MNKFLISASGVAMALVMSSTALGAVTIFTPSTTISSTDMNTNFANLNGNLTDGTCVGTPAMTRVGPTCVETARRAASSTWSAAVNTCRTAGRRLLTPGEYIAAKNLGTLTGMATNGELEWVDSVSTNGSADATVADGIAGRMTVGYMGPDTAANIGGTASDGDIFFGNNAAYDAPFNFIFFRCAR
jgi:hypothetical protein